MLLPISPKDQGTTSLSATTTSGGTTVALAISESPQLEINNNGSVWAFVRWGASTVGAATVPNGATGGSYAVPPNGKVVVTIDPGTVTHACAITASGTATVYLTPGRGQ